MLLGRMIPVGKGSRKVLVEMVISLFTEKNAFLHQEKWDSSRDSPGERAPVPKTHPRAGTSALPVHPPFALPSRHSSRVSQMQNMPKMLRIQMLAWWGTDPITPRAQGGAAPCTALLENTLQTAQEPETRTAASLALTPDCPGSGPAAWLGESK